MDLLNGQRTADNYFTFRTFREASTLGEQRCKVRNPKKILAHPHCQYFDFAQQGVVTHPSSICLIPPAHKNVHQIQQSSKGGKRGHHISHGSPPEGIFGSFVLPPCGDAFVIEPNQGAVAGIKLHG